MDTEDRLISDFIEQGRHGRHGKRRINTFKDLDPEAGLTRLSGSEADRDARDRVVKQLREMGMSIRIDAAGNILGRKEGTGNGKSIRIGSHVDSVRNGGMFDGNAGVFGGIEAVRRLMDEDFRNTRPLEIAVYTGEEGSAFSYGLLGSSVIAGKLDIATASSIHDLEGVTLEKRLLSIGYRGADIISLGDVGHHLELHVEQGPIMESNNKSIGIVERIVGLSEISIVIEGTQGHAGTVPMPMRKDPTTGLSEIINWTYATIRSISPSAVATIGRLNISPNSANVIPGRVELTIDVRDQDIESIRTFQKSLIAKVEEMRQNSGLIVSLETSFTHSPCELDPYLRDTIARTAESMELSNQRISSGAGHDSQNIAPHVSSGMIFVPSRGGVSHAPLEWTDWEDLENGVSVLAETVRKLASQ